MKLIPTVALQIQTEMGMQEISRTTLAHRLGQSRAHVTQLLDGKRNITLRTLESIGNALDMNIEIKLTRRR